MEVVNGCCVFFIVFVVVFFLILIASDTVKNKEIREKEEAEIQRARKAREDEQREKNLAYVENAESLVRDVINQFFFTKEYLFKNSFDFQVAETNIHKIVVDMKSAVEQLGNIGPDLDELKKIKLLQINFERFAEKVKNGPESRMMLLETYGAINNSFMEYVKSLRGSYVQKKIEETQAILDEVKIDSISGINLTELLACVWFYALENMESDFNNAKNIYQRVTHENEIELFIAELYVLNKKKNKIEFNDKIKYFLNDIEKYSNGGSYNKKDLLIILASGLMWMGAYRGEATILQHMHDNNFPMALNLQVRRAHIEVIGCLLNRDSYSTAQDNIKRYIDDMRHSVEEMESTENDSEQLTKIKAIKCEFDILVEKVRRGPESKMLDEKKYGYVNQSFKDYVNTFNSKIVQNKIDKIDALLQTQLAGDSIYEISEINITELLGFVWFYALQKTYLVESFEKAKKLYTEITHENDIELFIAELYAIKQMNATNVLHDKIREFLKDDYCLYGSKSDLLPTIASGLMWIGAFKEEEMVLQYMLANNIPMPAKLQERLNFLSNGGGDAPVAYDIQSEEEELYVDISSLAWDDKSYNSFFGNLGLEEKQLDYCLAIRDEDKNFSIAQKIAFPSSMEICNTLSLIFDEEYGESVAVKELNCIALSGAGKEQIDGVLVECAECKQLGIFVHVARIGKKANIKFYTLFVPQDGNAEEQKQQAVSMYKKLSPTVMMWENGIKNTILLAIQQLLNKSVETVSVEDVGVQDNGTIEF